MEGHGVTSTLKRNASIAGKSDRWTALYAGDTTLILEFGNRIDRAVVDQINLLDVMIHAAIQKNLLQGVSETVPTFRSLAIIYDPCLVHPDKLLDNIRKLESMPTTQSDHKQDKKHWRLPVLYGSEHGPDLENVSKLTNLSAEAVIELHVNCVFTAYMLGFLPGYAFLGDTPAPLHLPRRSEPRLRVPAGSVAIAMQLTGIYPWESPGGWHILGNCPVPLFDADLSPPALLKAGDKITFRKIDKSEFDDLTLEFSQSRPDRSRWDAQLT